MKHSVIIDFARCRGCTTCMKICPTEAIRVRRGKATILQERCIDCGACIRSCPHKAIKATSDPLARLQDFKYNVAVPDPALYGQFKNMEDINIILEGLTRIGFDDVYETAKAASLLSDYARKHDPAETVDRPIISSACPAVLRLIRIRFPHLIDNITPTVTPVELAAQLARKKAMQDSGLPAEEIGIFSICPCSAQVTAALNPDDLLEPVLDGAFSIRDIYLKLLSPMKQIGTPREMSVADKTGTHWAFAGGEGAARARGERYLAVDGMCNVIRILEAVEDSRITDVDFVELSACTHGCVGGCMTVEDPFVSTMRIHHLMDKMPDNNSSFEEEVSDPELVQSNKALEFTPVFLLDKDRTTAMKKMAAIHDLEQHLPGLLCGSCGAPSCHAFAEDVILGRADASDCIFQVRARMRAMAGTDDPDSYLPTPFRRGAQARPSPRKTEAVSTVEANSVENSGRKK